MLPYQFSSVDLVPAMKPPLAIDNHLEFLILRWLFSLSGLWSTAVLTEPSLFYYLSMLHLIKPMPDEVAEIRLFSFYFMAVSHDTDIQWIDVDVLVHLVQTESTVYTGQGHTFCNYMYTSLQ